MKCVSGMAKKYEKEKRFYVSIIDEMSPLPRYIDWWGNGTANFIYARHFESANDFKECVKDKSWSGEYYKNKLVIRSIYIEVNGFDLGEILMNVDLHQEMSNVDN